MKTRHIRGRVLPTAAVLLVAFAAALGLWLGARQFGTSTLPPMQAALLYPTPRAVPAFTLTRADGATLTREDWHGRWTLAFFGYTHCPDVCPTTLAEMKKVWSLLDPATKARVSFVFVSVDPQRDTPEQLAKYVGFFSPDFVAATGSDEQLTALTRALGLVYLRGTGANGEVNVDHSAQVVLMAPNTHQVGMFRPPLDATKIAADLTALAAQR